MNWISVKDRLPENGKDEIGIPVLTINEFGSMQVAVCGLSHGEIEWYEADNVTHWMPLPEAPKDNE